MDVNTPSLHINPCAALPSRLAEGPVVAVASVKAMMSVYKPGGLIPKDVSLTQQQGGLLVVRNGEVIFEHFDQGTGAWERVMIYGRHRCHHCHHQHHHRHRDHYNQQQHDGPDRASQDKPGTCGGLVE
jgi:hypothetical protein